MAVPARCHQAQKRRFKLRVREVQRRNVPAQMVHRHQGLSCRKGKALGKIHAHKHRADKPGRKGDGNGVQLLCGKARLRKRLLRHLRDVLNMAARSDFGHHAAIPGSARRRWWPYSSKAPCARPAPRRRRCRHSLSRFQVYSWHFPPVVVCVPAPSHAGRAPQQAGAGMLPVIRRVPAPFPAALSASRL